MLGVTAHNVAAAKQLIPLNSLLNTENFGLCDFHRSGHTFTMLGLYQDSTLTLYFASKFNSGSCTATCRILQSKYIVNVFDFFNLA